MEKIKEERKIKIDPNEGFPLKKGMVYTWQTQNLIPDSAAKDAEDICKKVSTYILSDSEESNPDHHEISNSKMQGFLYNTINVLSNGDIIVIAGAKDVPMFYKLTKDENSQE